MKLFLSLCVAAVGLVGFAPTGASAAVETVETAPAVVHVNETVVLVNRRHHHHHYYRHHRHYHYRHHHRYYY